MAVRARKPAPAHLRVVGTPGAVDPATEIKPDFDNGLEAPKRLNKIERRLWDGTIRRAPWLTEFDVQTAYMWVNLQARYLKDPSKFSGYLIGQLRAIRSELGFDPASRTRMKVPAHAKTKASTYFDG